MKGAVRTRIIPASAAVLLLALLVSSEKREHTPYLDVAGILTVCDGIIGPDVVAGKTYTDADCDRLARRYVERMSERIGNCTGGLTFLEWVAWGHFTYNAGTDGFCNSTAAKMLRAGDYAGACAQMIRWRFITKNGKKLDCAVRENKCYGIVNRRTLETDMCEAAL